jgi:hypothetical protein
MREIRLSGSEGGGTELHRSSLPLSGAVVSRSRLAPAQVVIRWAFGACMPARVRIGSRKGRGARICRRKSVSGQRSMVEAEDSRMAEAALSTVQQTTYEP